MDRAGVEGAAEADAFFYHDGLLGQQCAEGARYGFGGDRTARGLGRRQGVRYRQRCLAGADFVCQPGQCIGQVFLGTCQHVHHSIFRIGARRLARVGEKSHRRRRPDQDHVADASQLVARGVAGIRHAIDRQAAAATRYAGIGHRRSQPGAGRGGDAVRIGQRRFAQGAACQHDQHRLAGAQHARGLLHGVGRDPRHRQRRQRAGDHAARVPADV
ncbi:hypothetical protein D9M68_658910 [compost metagenome]